MSETDTVIDDPMLDDEWLAGPAKRSRLRVVLVITLAAAVCFLGGALVQKNFGTNPATQTAAPTGFGGGQLPEGLPGNIGQGGGFPDAASAGAPDDAAAPNQDDGSQSVIGKVVKIRGSVWIVEDLGGHRHQISVGDDTEVTRETSIKPRQVKVGDPVDITGTTTDNSSDGQLHANEVTLR